MGKSELSFSADFSRQILQRVGDGQKPEDVARQLGRTPATIRYCLSVIEEKAPKLSQRWSLWQRAKVLRNELIARFVSPRESRHVVNVIHELLRLHWIVSATHPNFPRRLIYRRIVMGHTGADEYEADTLLRRAEESFAVWPTVRELTFADVVHYLAVSEYLTDDGQVGTRIDMGRLVAGRIPPDL